MKSGGAAPHRRAVFQIVLRAPRAGVRDEERKVFSRMIAALAAGHARAINDHRAIEDVRLASSVDFRTVRKRFSLSR